MKTTIFNQLTITIDGDKTIQNPEEFQLYYTYLCKTLQSLPAAKTHIDVKTNTDHAAVLLALELIKADIAHHLGDITVSFETLTIYRSTAIKTYLKMFTVQTY